MPESVENARERVWKIVAAIPSGKVATYGQVAALAGMPSHSRLVGNILSRLPAGTRLPWHRVINAQGRLRSPNARRQRERLEREGITLLGDRVRLRHYQWQP